MVVAVVMGVVPIVSVPLDSSRLRLAQRSQHGCVTTMRSFLAMIPVKCEKVIEPPSVTAGMVLRN